MSEIVLKMSKICKKFGNITVLNNVGLELHKAEVLALCGENGAGKSTLMKILGGIYEKDAGQIEINGKVIEINDVPSANEAGIMIIHQELVMVPHMTVAENIFLGRFPTKNGVVDYDTMNKLAKQQLERFDLQFEPTDYVEDLSMGEKQMVEIVRAVSSDAKIIVMDEPTSSLSESETEKLFTTIKQLKNEEVSIIYISHRMSELNVVADTVMVLRDGLVAGIKPMSEITMDEIISMMVGRQLGNFYSRDYIPSEEIALDVKHLQSKFVHDISFQLKKGEILGFAGLVGAGRTETMRALFGIDEILSGEIILNGEKIEIKSPKQAINKGICLVPEDRRGCGIFPELTVKRNITQKVLSKFIHGISVNHKIEDEITNEYYNKLKVNSDGYEITAGSLSGGNQQKIVIAGNLAASPKILILDEPTRGIDVGAKTEIYQIMDELTKQGLSIIMVSSDMAEVINMSDRVVVMAEGKITKVLEKENISQEEIMRNAVLM